MKSKTGIISGFILGLTGFLFMFKLIFLDNIPPEDEVPPGIVVAVAILNGLLFGYVGYLLQNYFRKKGNYPKPS
ncbi:MAG: hypothetical protein ABL895_20665 [Cyclobacteriaceae bacterium]